MERTLKDLEPIKELIKVKALEECDALTSVDTGCATLRINVQDIIKEYLESRNINDPKWYITATAHTKMRMLVQHHTQEIGWYGTVEKHPNDQYIINDIIVYPQHVTGATCEQDESKMFDFEMSLTDDQVNTKRFQGHSHVNMGVSPSMTDETFYTQLLSQVNDYFMVCITNKAGAMFTRFYDVTNNIVYTDVPVWVINESGNCLDKWVQDQLKEKITERPYTFSGIGKGYKYDSSDSYYKQGSLFNEEPEIYWDPKTKSNMTAEEYKKKYGSWPKGYKKRGRPPKEKHGQLTAAELAEVYGERDEEFYARFRDF